MSHYPKRRTWPGRWLPDRCSCGACRFDRCPDAVADVISGAGMPRGGPSAGAYALTRTSRLELFGDDPASRLPRRW